MIFNEDGLLPCHYFDFMYGTSTGGLIATMLGRLRMTIAQCLEVYQDVGQQLFGKRRSFIPLATKYNHQPLEVAVRDIVAGHCKQHQGDCSGSDWHPWSMAVKNEAGVDLDRHLCQSICLTAVHNGKIDGKRKCSLSYTQRFSPANIASQKLIFSVRMTTSTSTSPHSSLHITPAPMQCEYGK